MAKKETTKKATKKVAKKLEEQAPIEVQEFEEPASLEVVEPQEEAAPAEVRQEILDKIKFDDAVLENLKKEDEKAIEDFETMNGDPAVVIPSKDLETAAQEEIKPKTSAFRRMFGYIWNGQEMDY